MPPNEKENAPSGGAAAAPAATTTRSRRPYLVYEEEEEMMIPYRTIPRFYVNGKIVPNEIAQRARPGQTLLQFLRDELHLTGSKLGCNEGGCGACTVMISKYEYHHENGKSRTARHYAVNACLMPVLAADHCHVTTVEGIGTVGGNNDSTQDSSSLQQQLHPVQRLMVDLHGSQCGFCTPGIIVSLYTLFTNGQDNNNHDDHNASLLEHLDGNLCRCTGYRPIHDAAALALQVVRQQAANDVVVGPCGTKCWECPQADDCATHQYELEDLVVVSSSESKRKTLLSSDNNIQLLLGGGHWRDQANQMMDTAWAATTITEDDDDQKNHDEGSTIPPPLRVVTTTGDKNGSPLCWIAPTTLIGLLRVLRDHQPSCKIVVGNTEVGIEMRFKHAVYQTLVHPTEAITELYEFMVVDDDATVITIGACCPLSSIMDRCQELMSKNGHDDDAGKKGNRCVARTVRPLHDMLRWFASTQIRNTACLGGNLVTASPIADMNPVLAALGAVLVLTRLHNDDDDENNDEMVHRRTVPVADFFLKYRTVALQKDEVVECVRVPVLHDDDNELEFCVPFKQARRREDDISIVTAGLRIRLAKRSVLSNDDDGKNGASSSPYTIVDATLAYGGMAPTTVLATTTAQALINAPFCSDTFHKASHVLLDELRLPVAVPGGQAAYRMSLAVSFLRKLFLSVAQELIEMDKDTTATSLAVDPAELNSLTNFLVEPKPRYRGTQRYPTPRVARGLEETILPARPTAATTTATTTAAAAAVGQAVPHASGALHCTGEAVYTDDIQLPHGTLQAALVLSSECGSVFQSMDAAPALAVDGVVGVFSYQDIVKLGGSNEMGPIVHDEVVFLPLGETVRTVGQVLGIVVAETLEQAEWGARMVGVVYEPYPKDNGNKIIVTIDDALAANSFYEFSRHGMHRGDVAVLDGLANTSTTTTTTTTAAAAQVGDTITVSGTFHSGAQEHFYLETNTSLVIPNDGGTNLTVYSSTQAPTKTQVFCASATGLQQARVAVKVKRMGGGFGGKETRSVFATVAAAVAAKRLNRPVRLTLARDVDMKLTGTRHAFQSTYRASATITQEGVVRLVACDVKLYANGGNAYDLSGPVVDRALFHVDGCYNYPHFRAEGVVCKTVQPPHTAFRGFGGPQGMAIAEHIIDHLAVACRADPDKIRRDNMYRDGDIVPFGMVIGDSDSGKWNVGDMWDRLYTDMSIKDLRQEVASYNAQHKWTKRGVSMTPTKFGIAFSSKYMNQGGALVHLYTDGTVLVSHGGTEMGQGLHTKVCQVVAQAFGIPLSHVYIDDSSTDKVANTIPTAASMSTDLYGMATLDACRQILQRLAPIRERLGADAALADIAKAAHFDRIDLSAHGFFVVDGGRCGFDWLKDKPADYPDSLPENSWKGHPFNYFTQGVACSLVEIDVLSGNHKTLRADVIVDVGSSINPSIDIGQIEGAFVQGMGWSTIEEVIYADDDHTWIQPRGRLFTTGPGTYKIPAFNDVPETFNVTLLDQVDNPFAVHSSKAIGEPPFFLGAAVFYAIKDAVAAARRDNAGGDTSYFEMRMPATSERIRMYALDELGVAAIQKMDQGDGGKPAAAATFQPQASY